MGNIEYQIKNLLDSAKYLKSEKIQTDLKDLPTYTPRDFVNPDIGERGRLNHSNIKAKA